MNATFSLQNIKLRNAGAYLDLESVPFFIDFESIKGEGENSYGTVCFHIGNAALAEALVKAINETLAAFEPKPERPEAVSDDDIIF